MWINFILGYIGIQTRTSLCNTQQFNGYELAKKRTLPTSNLIGAWSNYELKRLKTDQALLVSLSLFLA